MKTATRNRLDMADARREGLYSIGQAAERADVSVKMVRYYEAIGLVPRASRTQGGYRLYTENDIHQLVFIRRARALGFTIDEIGKLLALWRNKRRASAEVKRLALSHIDALEEKIAELEAMRDSLRHLARHCHGDERPDCPILEELAH
ncbi:MAG TPA: Cu(I)-responsive transcriptional regulator [Burkholderiales bacterium]